MLLIGIFHRQFSGREILMLKRELDTVRPDLIWEAVPHRPGMGSRIVKRIKPALGPAVIPPDQRSYQR